MSPNVLMGGFLAKPSPGGVMPPPGPQPKTAVRGPAGRRVAVGRVVRREPEVAVGRVVRREPEAAAVATGATWLWWHVVGMIGAAC